MGARQHFQVENPYIDARHRCFPSTASTILAIDLGKYKSVGRRCEPATQGKLLDSRLCELPDYCFRPVNLWRAALASEARRSGLWPIQPGGQAARLSPNGCG